MGVFEAIDAFVKNLLKNISQSLSSEFATTMFSIVAASFLLYFTIKAYAIFSGKIQSPVNELTWDLVGKLIIVSIMMNYGEYLSSALAIIDELKTSLGGINGAGLPRLMDSQLELGMSVANMLFDLDKSEYVPVEGAIASLLAWIGIGLSLFVPMFLLVTTTISLKLLTITAPIFIFCLLFGFLRNMFAQWLQLIFANILTVVFLNVSVRMGMKFFSNNATALSNQAFNDQISLILSGFIIVAFGLLMAVISFLSLTIAQNVASVSIEGSTQALASQGVLRSVNSVKSSIQNSFRFLGGASGQSYNRAPAAYKLGMSARRIGRAVRDRVSKSNG